MADTEFIPVEHLPYAKELKTRLPYAESKLRVKIGEAIGAGSACWENLEGAGVFESERAKKVAEDLIEDVLELTGMGEPNLGCATNEQLQNELNTRAQFGNTDPNYRTVD